MEVGEFAFLMLEATPVTTISDVFKISSCNLTTISALLSGDCPKVS
jgi:hypothetical protein